MKQTDMKNVHSHRQIAQAVAVSKTKKTKGSHAFSYPSTGVSHTSPRSWVEARDVGPGIITKGLPTSETDTKK